MVLLRACAESSALYESMSRRVVDAQGAPLYERPGTAIADTLASEFNAAPSASPTGGVEATSSLSPAEAGLQQWASPRHPSAGAIRHERCPPNDSVSES